MESESEAELASAASNANLSDIEEDSVYADELGLVFFDGKCLSHHKCCATLWRYTTALGNPKRCSHLLPSVQPNQDHFMTPQCFVVVNNTVHTMQSQDAYNCPVQHVTT